MQTLKSVFGGDASPLHSPNIATSVGLYMDSIILSDPLLRLTPGVDKFQEMSLWCHVLRHALNVLHYRELALAEVDPPIIIVAPDFQFIEGDLLDQANRLVTADLFVHCNNLFGRTFSYIGQLKSFLEGYPTSKGLAAAIADPSRIALDDEVGADPETQIGEQIDYITKNLRVGQVTDQAGRAFWMSLVGRVRQAVSAEQQSSLLHATSLCDAPASWRYLLWHYENRGSDY